MLGPSLLTRSGTVCEALAATTFVKFNLLDETSRTRRKRNLDE